MEKNEITLYDGKAFGIKVSDYGLENGYLDYQTLALMLGDCILNNEIYPETCYDWEMVNGEYDEDYMVDIYQWYIISDYGYKLLSELTDEYVFYNEKFDMYLWGITHFGTGWSHVLTDVKLKE